MAYTYIIECKDGTYYTGMTNNINERVKEHINGRCKYTREHKYFRVVYLNEHKTKGDAHKEELSIKQLGRIKKMQLIKSYKNRLYMVEGRGDVI